MSHDHRVAVVGAGPGGLAAARYLRQAGFLPTLFDQADGVGGQWRVGAPHSKVWPGMRTNSSRVMTAFGELAYPPGTAVYPTAEQVGAYLARYAERFELLSDARFGTRVESVARDAGAWRVRARGADGVGMTETFARVVVASGWCGRPAVPAVDGLDGFAGRGGVTHAAAYRGAAAFRGLRVLVAGGGISALEIASELAVQGAERVALASRRQRYVMQKLLAGVPADHVAFTRFAALAGETFPPAASAAALKALVVATSGRPEQLGAPAPADDLFAAGLTLSQHYLPLVAEGRIAPRPWIARVDGATVHFADGTAEAFDAIVLGTGYAPDLSYLGPDVRAVLGTPPALHALTLHPDLPGLAFLGQFEQVGPHLPTLELQARWIAYAWSGRVALPTREAMAARLEAAPPHGVPMQVAARLFARAAGVEPDPRAWPALARALLFGPMSPATFRLSGPDALPAAPAAAAADAAAFGSGADGAL
ncbi:FAD-dependent oxidoreductase, partial [Roseisolibacter sp. H3M3-2]|uniref:flavin-containing monooxygenase n=1 Tax=Roseisolibacter sp. H3M3-2 TaxID=3031323 RepID=UPI0023DCB4B8